MYVVPPFYEYKPLLLPGSAHAVVIRAAMLFVVHFPVINITVSATDMFKSTAGIFPNFCAVC